VLKQIANEKGYAPAQLALAWLLSRGEDIVSQIGMTSPARLCDHLAALDIRFTADELALLDRESGPGAIRGDRYPAFVMGFVAR
jgi:aryl-alcohol dehydrogenase-like predicted oxidoreductase